MKKIIIMTFCFFASFLVHAQLKVQIGDLYYLLSGVEASVTYDRKVGGYNLETSNYNNTEYVIPSSVSYNGYDYKVTKIDEGAFASAYDSKQKTYTYSNANNIKRICLPNSISEVRNYAFYGQHGLEMVDLSEVESLWESAFSNCTSLKSVSMSKVKDIDSQAFYNCTSLESVSMPNVKAIYAYAFQYCQNLVSIIEST